MTTVAVSRVTYYAMLTNPKPKGPLHVFSIAGPCPCQRQHEPHFWAGALLEDEGKTDPNPAKERFELNNSTQWALQFALCGMPFVTVELNQKYDTMAAAVRRARMFVTEWLCNHPKSRAIYERSSWSD